LPGGSRGLGDVYKRQGLPILLIRIPRKQDYNIANHWK
jgi:hypothetical protein